MASVTKPVFSSDMLDRSSEIGKAVAVDLRLVSEVLMADQPFTCDYGRRGKNHEYVHVSLRDELAQDEMDRVQCCIQRTLEDLARNLVLVLFVRKGIKHGEVFSLEETHIAIAAHSDDAKVNGQMHIVHIESADIDNYLEFFGNYDSIKGVALRPDKVVGFLQKLRLLDPVPSTTSSFLTGRPSPAAIDTALHCGEFFFEEIGNGTTLRIVSTAITDLRDRVVSIVTAEPAFGVPSKTGENVRSG